MKHSKKIIALLLLQASLGFADVQSDIQTLDQMAAKYRVSLSGPSDAERCIALLNDKKGADLDTYKKIAGSASDPQLQNKLTVVKNVWADFDAKTQRFINSSADDAKRRMKTAEMLVEKANSENAPGLASGAQQQIDDVNQYILLFETVDPKSPLAKELKASVEKISGSVNKYQDARTEQMADALKGNRAPKDVYSGGDKGKIKKMITDAWKAKYPQDKILGIHFHMANWERNKSWNANATSLYKNDTSTLGVKVAVVDPKNPAIVNLYMAYVNKDNQDDSVNVGVDTKGSQYVVEQVLKKNYSHSSGGSGGGAVTILVLGGVAAGLYIKRAAVLTMLPPHVRPRVEPIFRGAEVLVKNVDAKIKAYRASKESGTSNAV